MDTTRETIRESLERVKVVDPHCHLRPHKPSADNLADIVLYHHVWVELVSSGMGQYEVTRVGLPHELAEPQMPPRERVRRCLPYLDNIRSTTSGLLLRWLLTDLYGVTDLDAGNLDDVSALVQEKGADKRWQEDVLRRRCGIESSITVEAQGTPYSAAILTGRESLPINLVNGKRTAQEMLAAMDEALGREVRQASDFRDLLAAFVRALTLSECKFVAVWPLPYLTADLAQDEQVTVIIAKARQGAPVDQTELGSFSYFGVCCVLDELRKTDLRVVQCMVGADVLLPHRSIPHWNDRFPGSIARLANEYEDFHFNLCTASAAYSQDLAILAKHMPNISVAGYWWHTFYPLYIKQSLELRLDTVPLNKIIGYFSDAYHSEWCYPKLKLVKQILEDILVERVARGWYTLDLATQIPRQLFYDNPKTIYRL